jgi:hypothetical protein
MEMLTDRESLQQGFESYQSELEQEREPFRARLAVVEDLLATNRAQVERLLDLYLTGDFPRERLVDRQVLLDKRIAALEEERSGLAVRLQVGALTDGQIQVLEEFVAQVAEGLDVAGADYGTKRKAIEILEVQATLSVEKGQKVVSASCVVGETICNLHPSESLL